MKKILYFLITLLCLSVVIPAVPVIADLGDFNDYDSDYGSDSGSDWGWDSDDNNNSLYIPYSHSGGNGGGGSGDIAIAVIVVIVIVIISLKSKGNSGNSGSNSSSGNNIVVKNNTDEIVTAIQKYDENFSSDKYLSWVKEVFMTLQNAWSERDFSKVRPFEKEELYQQHVTQIQKYIDNNRINVLDRININQAYLYKYVRDKEYEYLTVYIQSRMTDYIKDATSGTVLKGDPNKEYHLRYLYTFMRKTGVTTDPVKSGNSTVACPHCGAPTSITSAGKCEYCGFVVTTGEFDWVLSNIEAIKAGVNIDNGGVVIRFDTENSNNNSNNTQN